MYKLKDCQFKEKEIETETVISSGEFRNFLKFSWCLQRQKCDKFFAVVSTGDLKR
jgi:hypothetical protein